MPSRNLKLKIGCLISVLLLLLGYNQLAAQARQADSVSLRTLVQDDWKKATRDLDYSKDLPESPKKEKKPIGQGPSFNGSFFTQNTQWMGNVLQVLAILLGVALIGWAIFKILAQPVDKVFSRDGVEITVNNLEDYIHETDLDRFLQKALKDRNYAQAIRIYYLEAIKQLSATDCIQWSRDKTNRSYLREMRQHQLGKAFEQITSIYEETWYGNLALKETEFVKIEPEFKGFLQKIKPNPA